MNPTKLKFGAFVLFVISVGVRSQSGDDGEIDDYDTYDNIERQRPRVSEMSRCEPFISRRCKIERDKASIKAHLLQLQYRYLNNRRGFSSDFIFRLPPAQPIDDTSPDFPELASQCPPGFQYVNRARSCYKVVYEEHNWTSADQRCRDLHPQAHLVAITKSEQNSALKTYLKRELARNSRKNICKIQSWGHQGKNMLWTSGRQLNETSCKEPFVWIIRKSIEVSLSSFTHWYPGEPNCSGNKEHCIHLRPNDDFLWNDIRCSEMFCPLCEYDPM